jgi:hypothetical protein
MENRDFEQSKWLPGGHLRSDGKNDGTIMYFEPKALHA